MDTTASDNEHRHALVEELRKRKVIAFVGSGCSTPLGYPTWEELQSRLVSKCIATDPSKREFFEQLERTSSSPLVVCELCRSTLGLTFYEMMLSLFSLRHPLFSREHEIMLRLPFKQVITTNYDLALEAAIWDAGFHVLSPTASDMPELRAFLSRFDNPMTSVLHLHGTFWHHPVLTEQDYAYLYTDPGFLAVMQGILNTHSALFVGFGMRDTDLMSLLGYLKRIFGTSGQQHFALLPKPPAPQVARADFQLRFNVVPVFYEVSRSQGHAGRLALLESLLADTNNGRPLARSERFVSSDMPQLSAAYRLSFDIRSEPWGIDTGEGQAPRAVCSCSLWLRFANPSPVTFFLDDFSVRRDEWEMLSGPCRLGPGEHTITVPIGEASFGGRFWTFWQVDRIGWPVALWDRVLARINAEALPQWKNGVFPLDSHDPRARPLEYRSWLLGAEFDVEYMCNAVRVVSKIRFGEGGLVSIASTTCSQADATSAPQAHALLTGKAPDGKAFLLKDGVPGWPDYTVKRSIGDLQELADYLSEEVGRSFQNHVSTYQEHLTDQRSSDLVVRQYKNDFSVWIRDVVGDAKLSRAVYASPTRTSMLEQVKIRIDRLKRIAGVD